LNARALFTHLKAIGLGLSERDGALLINAPRDLLTSDDRALIAEHKAELLALLREWPPRDPRLTDWPIPWRQAWGERANALEDTGLKWNDAERQAFAELLAMMESGAKEPPTSNARVDPPAAIDSVIAPPAPVARLAPPTLFPLREAPL
jgi:hypothetical protein